MQVLCDRSRLKGKGMFISIPRTASNNISTVMVKHKDSCVCLGHKKPDFGANINDYILWTCVRNTYDRIVSLCEHGLSGLVGRGLWDTNPLKKDKPALLNYYLTEFVPNNRKAKRDPIGLDVALQQLQYITSLNVPVSNYANNSIYAPLDKNVYVHIIIDFNSLVNDFKAMCDILNINVSLRSENNASNRDRDYKVYYNKENKLLVDEMFADDIEYFGHKYGDNIC